MEPIQLLWVHCMTRRFERGQTEKERNFEAFLDCLLRSVWMVGVADPRRRPAGRQR
jgi:hypothetical protein